MMHSGCCLPAGGDATGAAGGAGGNGGDAATAIGRKLQTAPAGKKPAPTPTITTTGGNGGNGGGAANKGPVTGGKGGDGALNPSSSLRTACTG